MTILVKTCLKNAICVEIWATKMKNMYYSRVVHKGGHIFEIYRVTQKKGKRFEPLNCGTVLPHTSLKDGINHKCLQKFVCRIYGWEWFDFMGGLISGTFSESASERLQIEIFINFVSFLGIFRHFMGIFWQLHLKELIVHWIQIMWLWMRLVIPWLILLL